MFCDVVLYFFMCVWTWIMYFVLDMYLDIFLHVSSIMLCGRVPLYVFGIICWHENMMFIIHE